MTLRQRENTAKYLYDLSKIVFAGAVLGDFIAWERFNVITLVFGATLSYSFLWWGYMLDGEEVKEKR